MRRRNFGRNYKQRRSTDPRFGRRILIALCSKKSRERLSKPQLILEWAHRQLIADQLPWVVSTLEVGVTAAYHGGIPNPPRTRGLPCQRNNNDRCFCIGEKFRKDIASERMFACATNTWGPAPVGATPQPQWGRKTRQNHNSGPMNDS